MLALVAYLFGINFPETYPREIIRARARRTGVPRNLPAAQSDVMLAQMSQLTFFIPLRMLVSEPLVIAISLYLALNFGVFFSWFISVPAVLNLAYGFNLHRIGLAFISAIYDSLLAALTSITQDKITFPFAVRKSNCTGIMSIKYRMYPAMAGNILMTASLFWVGWSATPTTSYVAPIFGTGVYVWDSMCILVSTISYLFDAYPPQGTLSALTAATCV
ncbi:MAG: hypothetical protein M1834_007384 [Cirrosporium novae-zelandiae]|nr:MAG: hypothetical protein M1834_007384 [Cirrosporium novae-zelandiae]